MPINITVTYDVVCPWRYVDIETLLLAINSPSDDTASRLSSMSVEMSPSTSLVSIRPGIETQPRKKEFT
jgi:predicted DsbA family dithiol-disulfide isomerase